MFQVRGFWLPDNEFHLVPFLEGGPEFAGGPTYQLHKFLYALPHVRDFRHAVDIGAHCGLWSRPMLACFRKLTAFEPVARHVECWYANVPDADDREIKLHQCALGAEEKQVRLHTGPASSGDTYVKDDGEHAATMYRLDQFELKDVDLIKIDCEGYEKFILQGGEATIRRDRPIIIIEQKQGKGKTFNIADDAGVKLLESWGARIIGVISGDYVMRWKSKA